MVCVRASVQVCKCAYVCVCKCVCACKRERERERKKERERERECVCVYVRVQVCVREREKYVLERESVCVDHSRKGKVANKQCGDRDFRALAAAFGSSQLPLSS